MSISDPKDKNKSVDSPFEILKDVLEKEESGVGITPLSMNSPEQESSWLKSTEKRIPKTRIDVELGYAIIYDSSGSKIINRAILRNVSPGGVGLEVVTIDLAKGASVMIEFGGKGLKIGSIKCTMQWMSPIKGHSKGHKLVGFQFSNPTPQLLRTLEKYFDDIKKNAGRNS